MSLKYRIAAAIFLLEVIMVSYVLWQTRALEATSAAKEAMVFERAILQAASHWSSHTLQSGNYHFLQDNIEGAANLSGVATIIVANREGRVVVSTDHSVMGSMFVDLKLADGPVHHWRTGKVSSESGDIGTVAVRFINTFAAADRTAHGIGLILAGPFIIASACISLWMGQMLTRRLGLLTSAAQAMAAGETDITLPTGGRDEIAGLAQAFDHMAKEIRAKMSEVRASEQKYQDLYDNAPAMFASVETATMRVTECNQTYLNATGYRKEEVLGRKIHDLYHPDCLEDVEKAFAAFVRSGMVKDLELELRRKDGAKIAVVVNVSAVRDRNGVITHSRTVWRDNTERMQNREALRQHEAELALVLRRATLDQMAAKLAHELNQPLGSVVNFANGSLRILRNRRYEAGELEPVLQRISEEAQRASNVLSGIRRFVGQSEPKTNPVALGDVLRSVAVLLNAELRTSKVRLSIEVPDHITPMLGDRIAFEQVFLNLIKNAIEAMRETGAGPRTVTVKAVAAAQDTLDVTVRDTGPGFAGETGGEAFEPFVTTKSKGLGMGLSICQTTVEAHGGRIWIERDSGGGVVQIGRAHV